MGDGRKDDMIRIRVTKAQKRVLIDAAEGAGLEVSTWLRVLGLREAGALSAPLQGSQPRAAASVRRPMTRSGRR